MLSRARSHFEETESTVPTEGVQPVNRAVAVVNRIGRDTQRTARSTGEMYLRSNAFARFDLRGPIAG